MVTVAICVLTHRRPDMLRKALRSIADLEFPSVPEPTISVIVIDNDAGGSARSVVRELTPDVPWAISYEVEPVPGIAAARNRAVAVARNADFIAFLDDDELADPRWLNELLAVQARLDADVITGPVERTLPAHPPAWTRHVGFFSRVRRPTGSLCRDAGTGNLLIRTSTLLAVPGPFDMRFGLTGGSDTHLSLTLRRRGVQIVWADDAVVEEPVGEDRLTIRWLCRRKLRSGNNLARSHRILGGRTWWVGRLLSAAKKLGESAGLALLAIFRGPAAIVPALEASSFMVGTLLGVVGIQISEYGRLHVGSGSTEPDVDSGAEGKPTESGDRRHR